MPFQKAFLCLFLFLSIGFSANKEFITIAFTETEGLSWERQYQMTQSNDHQIIFMTISPTKFEAYEKEHDFSPTSHETKGITLIKSVPVSTSQDQLEALKTLTNHIIKKYSPKHLTLKYSGHGSGDINLFGRIISGKSNVEAYLSSVVQSFGKKIDILDWNTNCNVLSVEQLIAQTQYSKYFIASEFERGGYNWVDKNEDGSTVQFSDMYKYWEDNAYLSTRKKGMNNIEITKKIIDHQYEYWSLYPIKKDMKNKNLKQSLYVIDSDKFITFYNYLNLPKGNYSSKDLLEVVKEHDPTAEPFFHAMIVHGVSNKTFFNWYSNESGPRFDVYTIGEKIWGNNQRNIKLSSEILSSSSSLSNNSSSSEGLTNLEELQNSNISISSHQISIYVDKSETINVFDFSGNIVHSQKISSGKSILKLNIPSGVYFIKTQNHFYKFEKTN